MFEAEITHTGQGGHVVVVPADATATLSSRRAAVIAEINGSAYDGKLMVWGGKTYLGLRKDFLRRIGIAAGDRVRIELTEAPPVAEVVPDPVAEPAELTSALTASRTARAAFDALPPDHRQEYVRWITASDESEVRSARITRMLRRIDS